MTRPRRTPAPRLTRAVPIDIARALAVIGVVFHHSVQGLQAAGLLDLAAVPSVVDEALHLMRMPAFVFIVGLFLARGVERYGVRRYLVRRSSTLVYLLLLWQVLLGVVLVATSPVRNSTTAWLEIVQFWRPLAILWFLPFLALATVVVVVLRPWRGRLLGAAVLAALLVVSILTWGWGVTLFGLNGAGLTFFLALGSVVGVARLSRWMARPLWQWAVAGVVATAGFVAMLRLPLEAASDPGSLGIASQAASLAAAALGVVALLALAVLLARLGPVARGLSSIGRSSIPIYLAHLILTAGARILLSALGITDSGILLVATVTVGVLVPFLLAKLARRLHLGWLFELPAPLARLVDGRDDPSPRRGAAPRDTRDQLDDNIASR